MTNHLGLATTVSSDAIDCKESGAEHLAYNCGVPLTAADDSPRNLC